MTLADFKVIWVMSRSDFYATCSEFLINIFIGNNRNFSVCKRKKKHFTDKILISFIFRINCNSSITKECFRSGRCDD